MRIRSKGGWCVYSGLPTSLSHFSTKKKTHHLIFRRANAGPNIFWCCRAVHTEIEHRSTSWKDEPCTVASSGVVRERERETSMWLPRAFVVRRVDSSAGRARGPAREEEMEMTGRLLRFALLLLVAATATAVGSGDLSRDIFGAGTSA